MVYFVVAGPAAALRVRMPDCRTAVFGSSKVVPCARELPYERHILYRADPLLMWRRLHRAIHGVEFPRRLIGLRCLPGVRKTANISA